MKAFNLDVLVRDIRIALDENDSSAPLIDESDIDTLSMEDIVKSKLVDAVRAVEENAPLSLLSDAKELVSDVHWHNTEGDGSGYVVLPDDFLRLVWYQMSDWSYGLSSFITSDSPVYQQQFSKFSGIRGNKEKPVVAIVNKPAGLTLEFFSCSGGADVTMSAKYIPLPSISDNSIEICSRVKPAVVYYAAHLTALTLGDEQRAAAMMKTYNDLIGIEENG